MIKPVLITCSTLLVLSSQILFASEQEILYAYKPLPPGAVHPEGWLLDWAEAARDGITGHLDERSNTFKKGWSGEHFRSPGVKPHGTGWPLEQCAYWLDGLVRLAYILDDDELIHKARSRLDPIVDAVNNGKGESLIHWRPKSALDDGFNNWAHSHMARALVAYHQATGDPRILDALVKVYRDFPLPDMPIDIQFQKVSGAVNVDPMIDTYLASRDPQVLKNLLAYANREPFAGLVENWRTGKAPDGHNVVFYENARVPALLYSLTGNPLHLEATKRLLSAKHKKHELPLGLTSGEEYQSGIGSTRYVETCNVACGGWTFYWLLRIEGDACHGDRMEKIFFNAGPVPLSRDFKLISYYQVPNRTAHVLKPADGVLPEGIPRVCEHVYSTLARGPLCCVGNCNRIVPNYIEHMWMTAHDGSPVAMLYGPCTLKTTIDDVPVRIESVTGYPFEESITMKVRATREVEFPMGLRIPGWCKDPKIAVRGHAVAVAPDEHGFVWLNRKWGPNDTIRLSFPMKPDVVTGRETPIPVITRTLDGSSSYHTRALTKRDDVSSPFAYVTYGPLLFALPLADKTPNEPVEGEKWNYALDLIPVEAQRRIEVHCHEMKRPWNWSLDAPIKLVVDARRFDWAPTMTQPLPPEPVDGGDTTRITLVPYGCTKFHITLFPVTDRMAAAIPGLSEANRAPTPNEPSPEPERGVYFDKKTYGSA